MNCFIGKQFLNVCWRCSLSLCLCRSYHLLDLSSSLSIVVQCRRRRKATHIRRLERSHVFVSIVTLRNCQKQNIAKQNCHTHWVFSIAECQVRATLKIWFYSLQSEKIWKHTFKTGYNDDGSICFSSILVYFDPKKWEFFASHFLFSNFDSFFPSQKMHINQWLKLLLTLFILIHDVSV